MYTKYNDYELLYLIDDGSELAYQAMLEKYSYLIQRKLTDFHIKPKYRDDYYQECLIELEFAIRTFDEYRGKSFTSYFTVLLVYKIQRLLKTEKNYFYNVMLVEDVDTINEDEEEYHEKDINDIYKLDLSKLEIKILNMYLSGIKPNKIAEINDVKPRAVYNAMARIKDKYKKKQKIEK